MRITKLTDYAIILLCEMKQEQIISSKQLSTNTHIPYATVNKIMRMLVNSSICSSKGGKNGGFMLAKPLTEISVLNVISSIEGLYDHITDCLGPNNQSCAMIDKCKISKKMHTIDNEIYNLLKTKYLSELVA